MADWDDWDMGLPVGGDPVVVRARSVNNERTNERPFCREGGRLRCARAVLRTNERTNERTNVVLHDAVLAQIDASRQAQAGPQSWAGYIRRQAGAGAKGKRAAEWQGSVAGKRAEAGSSR